ncbi:MAG TPA: VOC family protein, partial [Candidatus Binatia bacterium]
MLIARKAVICSRCLVTEPWVRSFIFARVLQPCYNAFMSVQVYGCNHLAIEVDDVEAAVKFYKDVFNLEKMNGGEGDAFLKLGEHQFLAIFEVEQV